MKIFAKFSLRAEKNNKVDSNDDAGHEMRPTAKQFLGHKYKSFGKTTTCVLK